MELKNCPECGKLFSYEGVNDLCYVCREEQESDFKKVKDYLWEYPNATIEDVHEETGVDREIIIKFIRDDRLVAEGLDVSFELQCKRCETPIQSGRFCERCKKELVDGLNSDSDDKEKRKRKDNKESNLKGKMFTGRNRKKRRRR